MADSKFVVDGAALDRFLDGNDGVSRGEAKRIGRAVVTLAKRHVGVKSGRLRKNIGYRLHKIGRGYEIIVTADTHYALMHHEGTRPHRITPNGNRVMRFKASGKVVYAQRVFHPGTRPNPFLVRAMREVVR